MSKHQHVSRRIPAFLYYSSNNVNKEHSGRSGTCSRFKGLFQQQTQTLVNLFSCTVGYILKYMTGYEHISFSLNDGSQNCLGSSDITAAAWEAVEAVVSAGEAYTIDEQCQFKYGESSAQCGEVRTVSNLIETHRLMYKDSVHK